MGGTRHKHTQQGNIGKRKSRFDPMVLLKVLLLSIFSHLRLSKSNARKLQIEITKSRKLWSTKVFPFQIKTQSVFLSPLLLLMDLGSVSETFCLPEIAIIFFPSLVRSKILFYSQKEIWKYEIDFFLPFAQCFIMAHMCFWTYINGMCVDVCTVIFTHSYSSSPRRFPLCRSFELFRKKVFPWLRFAKNYVEMLCVCRKSEFDWMWTNMKMFLLLFTYVWGGSIRGMLFLFQFRQKSWGISSVENFS